MPDRATPGPTRVTVVTRSDEATERRRPDAHRRFPAVIDALVESGVAVSVESFSEAFAEETSCALAESDAALVWVDPINDDQDRNVLDDVLRTAADRGTVVYTHPDTILKMGTKDVLYDTRSLSWSLDTDRYDTLESFSERFPSKLATGARVLKQYRGNGGLGVWKVSEVAGSTDVRIQHAANRDGTTEDVTRAELVARMTPYFERGGHLIDQAFAPRVSDGMVRAYLVKGAVVGFARQYAGPGDAEHSALPSDRVFGIPSAKTMRGADDPEFGGLRRSLEVEWVPGLMRLLKVSEHELPLLWDADFLFGPTDDAGNDRYALCEINASCVSPFPPAVPKRVAAVLSRELGHAG